MEYKYIINPPVRCSNCSTNLVEILKTDRQLIELAINGNETKKNKLRTFLSFSKNKKLLTHILDPEIRKRLEPFK